MLVVAGRRGARRTEMTSKGGGRKNIETQPRAPPADIRPWECIAHARAEVGPEVWVGGSMAGYGVANERLRALEELEREIGAALQSAGSVILELSKEKAAERLLERQAAAFGAAVAKVEAELGAQIRYLTQVATGQPHEGSSYAARKGCQLALNRMEYARRRLAELARGCQQLLDA
ncbi:mediator of RNA polymerase II transcription subunit 11 [Phasianus colchicus]|uniref:Mediator of RNA polymerase II transcription subunit 11 n=2 Tax=Phasianidae TaxID=9005 RepID=A0A669Q842_PHACC|nr:mediator of RNA polymerase II transcription subunit 11 [Phasianus colchicus]